LLLALLVAQVDERVPRYKIARDLRPCCAEMWDGGGHGRCHGASATGGVP
jgi:hypothetical protein